MSGFIGIRYTEPFEGAAFTYQQIYGDVDTPEGEKEFVFNSGCFPVDWYEAMKFLITHTEHWSESSSLNHFFWDGGSELFTTYYIDFNSDPLRVLTHAEYKLLGDSQGLLDVYVGKGVEIGSIKQYHDYIDSLRDMSVINTTLVAKSGEPMID
jgi:hypothetical protein